MGERFNLTAQLQLQAPTNTRQVISQIRSQLQGVNVNVQVTANSRSISQVNSSLQNTTRQANDAARSIGFLNKNLSEAARRFGVITLATGTMLSFAQSVKRAFGEAVEFERELIRIAQTTGKSVKELSDLSNEVTRLATSLGVSSSSLLKTANILAQAGFSAKTTKQALDILAKTTLGPTFDDVSETVEGAVSVLSQFRQEAIAAGGDIKFLESVLDAINSVSKAFAVESSDLITVIRRTGGVFAAAGGSVNELIALFTSVRATTRESAETIATGLRTIFTRIQRTDTVNQLEALGISLRDAQGRFVGAFEAVKRLSIGLSSLDPRDYRFSEIIEELGGFRQIGKVIPLIQQFAVAQDALNVAQAASGSVAQDAVTAQQALAVQAQKVSEQFSALIRQLANSSTFREIASGALELASALIKIASALEPVLPLLTSFLALKVGQGLAPGLTALLGFGGARRRASGGVIRKYARGGFVPGTGNRDTVPAMLQPGEFVIRKSSVNKIGANNLAAMNENGYAAGGQIKLRPGAIGGFFLQPEKGTDRNLNLDFNAAINNPKVLSQLGLSSIGSAQTRNQAFANLSKDQQAKILFGSAAVKEGKNLKFKIDTPIFNQNGSIKKQLGFGQDVTNATQDPKFLKRLDNATKRGVTKLDKTNVNVSGPLSSFFPGGKDDTTSAVSNIVTQNTISGLESSVRESIQPVANLLNNPIINFDESRANKAASTISGDPNARKTTEGFIFEGLIQGITGAALSGNQSSFDFPASSVASSKDSLAAMFGPNIPSLVKADAKRTNTRDAIDSIKSKITNDINAGRLEGIDIIKKNLGGLIQRFAKGSSGKGVESGKGILPRPGFAIADIIKAGGGFVDIDRTLLRTVGDIAYGKARTDSERDAVLKKYFLDPAQRLKDIRSAGLTQFGKELQSSIKSGKLDGRKVKVVSKSTEVEGLRQYLSGLFGIPSGNMKFTSGSSKVPFIRGKGPLVDDIPDNARFASGGGVGTDTVPALLTPGEFVINKKSAQSIGYGSLNRMNKVGKYAKGGPVGIQKFDNGGIAEKELKAVSASTLGDLSGKQTIGLKAAIEKSVAGFRQLVSDIDTMPFEAQKAALLAYSRAINSGTDSTTALDRANAAAMSQVTKYGNTASKAAQDAQKRPVQQSLAGEQRATGSVGVRAFQASGDAVVRAQQELDSFGTGSKAAAKGMLVFTTTLRQTGDEAKALSNAYAAAQKVRDDENAATKKLIDGQKTLETVYKEKQSQLKKSNLSVSGNIIAGTVGRVGSAVGGREGVQAGVQRLDQVAGAAQQFAFLAGAAAALGSQFGGLSETTSRAISETAAYASSLVGIGGTIVQMFTSMLVSGTQQTASTTTNSISQQTCAAATSQNATAQSLAARQGLGLANGLAAGALAAIAISSAFKYFASLAQAEADQLKKAADEQLAAIERGTGSIDVFSDQIMQSAAKASSATALEAGANTALTAGLAGAAIGAAVGAFFGPLGAIVGGLIGAIGGGIAGLFSYSSELAKQKEIAKQFGDTLQQSTQNLGSLIQAQARFEQELQDIDVANLAPEQRISRRLTAQSDVSDVNQSALSNAQASLAAALSELSSQTGKSVSELTEADFKKFPLLANIVDTSRKAISKATEGIAKDVAESRKTLQEAAQKELTGNVSLEEILRNPANQLTQALLASESSILAETRARIDALREQFNSAKSDKEKAAITKQVNDEQARYQKRIIDGREALSRQAEEARKNKESLERTRAAQEAYRQSLERISVFTNQLVSANEALNKFETRLDNATAIREGTSLDFTRQAPAGLSDLSQVGNRDIFNREVDAIGASLGPVGQELAVKVKSTSQAIESGRKKLIGLRFAPDQPIDTKQILKDIGLDPESIPREQFAKIDEELRKALEDGIDEEEFNKIFAPIIEEGTKAAEALKNANDLQNREITLYGKYLDQLQAQRDKEISARQQLIDVQTKGAELRARARGTSLSREQSQRFRNARAQTALMGITMRGSQIRAGDVGGVSATRDAAQAEREKIAEIKNSAKWDKLSQAEKAKLIEKDKQLIKIISKTGDELQRLSDQSEAAAEIMSQIEEERATRETLTGIVTDFVVGNNDERQAINKTFENISKAIFQGTLQNQSPEERKAVVDMLDKLGNIPLMQAGGLTGKQVKQELIFRDAIRLGLDPQIARQLATATSKEEQLIMALDKLTFTMEQAAGAIAGGAGRPPIPVGRASGGIVQYRAKGGTIFRPKGTDTVPAMLTPGEFVIKKSAVDKIGVNNLTALNNGNMSTVGYAKGGVVYRQAGGPINIGNAQFGGQAQNIDIISGNQYKSLIKSIISRNPFAFANMFKDERTKQSIIQLLRANQFDISKVRVGEEIASVLDTFISQQGIFESIGGGGFTLRIPNMEDSVKNYRDKLSNITLATSNAFAAAGLGANRTEIDSQLLALGGYGNFIPMIKEAQEFLNKTVLNLNNQLAALRAVGKEDATFGELRGAGMLPLEARTKEFTKVGIRGLPRDGRENAGGGVLPRRIQEAIEYLRNNARIYFNTGGSVNDTVPAMLTPGEFVMNKSAVQKHGIAMMESLNRGQIPGFNRGGLVGNVQYKRDGGTVNNSQASISVDPSKVQNVFTNFLGNFSVVFDNIVQKFSNMETTFGSLVQSLNGITMTHTVTVEGLISIGGLNLESIKQELSSSIGQMVAQEITTKMDAENRRFKI